MSKAVLISVKPKWCELIASGKKTVEVRKTKPKLETPFKVYIYCTDPRHYVDKYHCYSFPKNPLWLTKNGVKTSIGSKDGEPIILNGKVIGEFVCDAIISHCEMENADIAEQQGCIKREDLIFYAGDKELYGWHISDLKIYDKPKELSEFKNFCKHYYDGDICEECKYFIDGRGYEYDESDCACNGLKPIERPPQSWCYVEECSN